MSLSSRLFDAISSLAPIKGVSVGLESDRNTWIVEFQNTATASQRSAVQQAIVNYVDDIVGEAVNRIDDTSFKIALNHENRIRALEAKQPITAAQFRAALKAVIV